MKAIYDAFFFARSKEMGAAKPGALTAAADFAVKSRLWSNFEACPCGPRSTRLSPVFFERQAHRPRGVLAMR
jgi:hypothetical protein